MFSHLQGLMRGSRRATGTPPGSEIFIISGPFGSEIFIRPVSRDKGFIIFGSTHVVEQLSSYTFSSIPTFDFDLILGSLFTFLGPNWLILGSG